MTSAENPCNPLYYVSEIPVTIIAIMLMEFIPGAIVELLTLSATVHGKFVALTGKTSTMFQNLSKTYGK